MLLRRSRCSKQVGRVNRARIVHRAWSISHMIKHTQFLLKLLQGVPFQNKLVHLLRNHVRKSRLPRTRSFLSRSIRSTYLWYEDTWPRCKDYSSLLRNKQCLSVLQDAFRQDWYIQLNWIINYFPPPSGSLPRVKWSDWQYHVWPGVWCHLLSVQSREK